MLNDICGAHEIKHTHLSKSSGVNFPGENLVQFLSFLCVFPLAVLGGGCCLPAATAAAAAAAANSDVEEEGTKLTLILIGCTTGMVAYCYVQHRAKIRKNFANVLAEDCRDDDQDAGDYEVNTLIPLKTIEIK
uniref:Uncharacterized protein n=1 Tax=Glossina pallidipes TaxID=7398 RepID=A0A1B0A0G9_GLOPL